MSSVWGQAVVVASLDDQDEGAEEAIVEVKVNYDYLLSMPINSLTLEKVRDTMPTFAIITENFLLRLPPKSLTAT